MILLFVFLSIVTVLSYPAKETTKKPSATTKKVTTAASKSKTTVKSKTTPSKSQAAKIIIPPQIKLKPEEEQKIAEVAKGIDPSKLAKISKEDAAKLKSLDASKVKLDKTATDKLATLNPASVDISKIDLKSIPTDFDKIDINSLTG